MTQGKYTYDDWKAVRESLQGGGTLRSTASKTGVNRQTVWRWSLCDRPPDWMLMTMRTQTDISLPRPARNSPKARLSYEDRCYIAAKKQAGASNTEIARCIGVHPSTIGRELSRCPEGQYDPRMAQRSAGMRGRRPKERKIEANLRLRSYVVNALMLKWSPEQISRRVRQDHPDDKEMRVSAETIYQTLYVQGKGALRHELGVQLALRSGRRRRKPQSKLPKGKPWIEGANISERPAEADGRAIPGHWEGDLIIGGDMSSCLVTLVERTTRLLLMSRLTVHDADTVEQRLERMVAEIPAELRRSLTWDQGSEMAKASDFELATNFKVYFCDPHSPWQRPSNENTNGLIREFFPKGTDFTKVTDEEVAKAQWLLNNRPRKVLNWKMPSEMMRELLNGDIAMTA